jgi:phosphatidylglycerophosphate synthase
LTLAAVATAAQLGGLPALLPALPLVLVAIVIAMSAALATDSDGPGPADLITGLRLGMAIGIGSAALFAAPKPALVTALLLIALATDAFDGWLARGSGTASSFGARFDLETDAVLLAAASLHAAAFAGALVLVAPLLRPAWVISCRFLPWLDQPLPPSRRRQTLCALPIFLLIFVPWPLGGSVWAAPVGLTAVLLLFVSFAIDVVHQWLRRAASSPA